MRHTRTLESLSIEMPPVVDLMCAINFVTANEREKQGDTQKCVGEVLKKTLVVVFGFSLLALWVALQKLSVAIVARRPSSQSSVTTTTTSDAHDYARSSQLPAVHSLESCSCVVLSLSRPLAIFHANYL